MKKINHNFGWFTNNSGKKKKEPEPMAEEEVDVLISKETQKNTWFGKIIWK